MEKSVFITGVSSGLGMGFAKCFLEKQWTVYGISRRHVDQLSDHPNFHFHPLDLQDFPQIPSTLKKLLIQSNRLNLVILNAGILGKIGDMHHTKLPDLKQIMDINLWSNKILLDYLFENNLPADQVISISSGAAVNGNRGWGGYSISKAALNMLIQLYAREYPETHFTSLAPGLVDTAMQDYLCEFADETRYPSVKKLKAARNTPAMPKPREAAENIISLLPQLLNHESGSFVDIRNT